MKKIYFVCMGNYYRSRLAEELALHYATLLGVDIQVDSGGLSNIPNPNNPGTIAKAVLQYLDDKRIQPRGATRYPKSCVVEDIDTADLLVLTDVDEQSVLFQGRFPGYKGQIIGWDAHDIQYAPIPSTVALIDQKVNELILNLQLDKKA